MTDVELDELTDSLLSKSPIQTSQTTNEQTNRAETTYTIEYKGTLLTIHPKNWRHSNLLKFQIILSFYLFILVGISDQTIGSLMPSLLTHYSTTQSKLTTIFILQFSGYALSAISNNYIHVKFGRIGVMLIATGLHTLTSFIESTRPPMVLFLIVYFFYGLSIGLLDSGLNVYLSGLVDHNEIMGFLHGFYGVGSVVGPPMASFILKYDTRGMGFGFHYFILGCLAFVGFVLSCVVFKDETPLKYEYNIREEHSDVDVESRGDGDGDGEYDVSFIQLIKSKLILVFSVYLFIYIGTEVGIGTWLLSYLIKVKQLDQISASFNVSWFWIGLTLGRMGLGFATKYFKNEYVANLWYSLISLITFLIYTGFLIVANPDNLGDNGFGYLNKILVFITGVWIGPLFPTSNVALMKILPKHLHVSAVGIFSSIGGSGSAIIPFLIGILIEWTSFQWLPVFISVCITLYVVIWWIIPKLSLVDYDF